ARLESLPWPGNIRELRNVLERGAILADGPVLEPRHLWMDQGVGFDDRPRAIEPGTVPDVKLEELERMAILQAVEAEGGNRKRAAERLGIGLRTLFDKLRRYGVQ